MISENELLNVPQSRERRKSDTFLQIPQAASLRWQGRRGSGHPLCEGEIQVSRRPSLIAAAIKNPTRRLSSFAASKVQQKFSEQQKRALSKYSSVSYAPTHSELYQAWLREHAIREAGTCFVNWDRWLLLSLIGICIGLVATLLKQCIQALNKVRWDGTRHYIEAGNLSGAWGWNVGIAIVYVLISSFLICFVHPPAAGGGTPEVISFLNGIVVHGSLNLKNLIVKFTANVFAVGSGLPAAIQGPIINYGAIIGAGVGQFQSRSIGWTPAVFKRFRNAEDRRAFTTAGVAAGVAAAFNAPIGGLLFAMEDLSSFWSKHLSWQTFFCCVVATAVASIFNTAFTGFHFRDIFGLFSLSLSEPIQIHIAILAPAVVLGLMGGVMGAVFTQLNRGFILARKSVLEHITHPVAKSLARMAETVLLVMLIHTYTTILPKAFGCTKNSSNISNSTALSDNCFESLNKMIRYETFGCERVANSTASNDVIMFNEAATLSMSSGQAYLNSLWSRSTLYAFDYPALLSVMSIWVVMTAWTAGSAIAGGIFVPTLITGSLYGRALGVGLASIWSGVTGNTHTYPSGEWAWIDPGVMSVIGAASMLSGVTRLAIAATVIVEMSHDIDLVIPVLIAILVAKFVADFLSKPIFKMQLERKTLPYLDQDPQVVVKGQVANLELYKVGDVMKAPVITIHSTEAVGTLAKLLVETDHGAFPVVRYDEETRTELALGLITRNELYVILCNEEVYGEEKPGAVLCPDINYAEISVDYIADPTAKLERLRTYVKFSLYSNIYLNLDPFINLSAPKMDQEYSLYRAYVLFRTLGLRHLIVIDTRNRVVGMVTRKDLMAFNISEKLGELEEEESSISDSDSESDGCDIILPSVTIAAHSSTHVTIQEEEEEEGQEAVDTPTSDNSPPPYRSREATPTSTTHEDTTQNDATIDNTHMNCANASPDPVRGSLPMLYRTTFPSAEVEPSIVQQLSAHSKFAMRTRSHPNVKRTCSDRSMKT